MLLRYYSANLKTQQRNGAELGCITVCEVSAIARSPERLHTRQARHVVRAQRARGAIDKVLIESSIVARESLMSLYRSDSRSLANFSPSPTRFVNRLGLKLIISRNRSAAEFFFQEARTVHDLVGHQLFLVCRNRPCGRIIHGKPQAVRLLRRHRRRARSPLAPLLPGSDWRTYLQRYTVAKSKSAVRKGRWRHRG
jgi:hypothetical protein